MKKPFRTPRWVEHRHQAHVKQHSGKPQPGCFAFAEGHGLRMVEVTTIGFECECGEKLPKPRRKVRT